MINGQYRDLPILRDLCPDCASFWGICIENSTCGKCMQPSEQSRQLNSRIRNKEEPIPRSSTRYVETIQKCIAWYGDATYRANLSEQGWTEEQLRQYDALVLEDHSHEATLGESDDGRRTGILCQIKKGKQNPMRQHPDFREAKQAHRQLFKEHVESTGERNSSIHPADKTRQSLRQRFKGFEEYNFLVHPRTGWKC